MNILQLSNGSKHFGTKTLFANATFSINEGEHIAVIGPNGAGKSTLFKILVGKDSLDSGELIKSQKLKIGYLEQESDWNIDISTEDFLAEKCSKPLWQLKELGKAIGLEEVHFHQLLKNLSGGYRMRVQLLYLIGQEPTLMLLDEPTNFLDLESIIALEQFLKSYEGAFLLISHDREFLRKTTDRTVEIESGEITKFPGVIDDFFEHKKEITEILEAQKANLDLKRKAMEDFVNRFRAKATKAKQAQSRMKQLEKMEEIHIKSLPVRAHIHIPEPLHTGKETLHIEQADLGYSNDKIILADVNLRIEKGSHLGIVGRNGAGKSTLLKSLSGRLPLIHGSLKLGYQVTLSYFAQHSADEIDLNDTVLESLQKLAHPSITQQEILNLAGSLLFQGDDVYKKVKLLSGGEKSRVALGMILLKKSPVLILDEPTNHLDFETVEALSEALKNYPGTIVVVSHDRSFISRVANQILEINNGQVQIYPGTYSEYIWSLENGAMAEASKQKQYQNQVNSIDSANKTSQLKSAANNSTISAPLSEEKFNYKVEQKKINTAIKEVNQKIKKLESSLTKKTESQCEINTQLIQAKGVQAQEFVKQLSVLTVEIQDIETELLDLLEQLETQEKKLAQLQSQGTENA